MLSSFYYGDYLLNYGKFISEGLKEVRRERRYEEKLETAKRYDFRYQLKHSML
jgi:hypothetical protein